MADTIELSKTADPPTTPPTVAEAPRTSTVEFDGTRYVVVTKVVGVRDGEV